MLKDNNLLEFYTDVLTTLKVKINDDGGLYIPTTGSKGKLPFTLDNKHMYLPTKYAIKTALEPDDSNKLQVVKELFNPIDESVNKGDNKSLLRLKLHIDKLLNYTFSVVGETLFKVLADPKIEINDIVLLEIVNTLSKKKTAGRKTMVDDLTIKSFRNIYLNRISKINELFMHTFIKRGGKIEGVTYNRISVLSFPILEEVVALKKDETIDNVKLRLKDKDAIEVLYTTIFARDTEDMLKGLQYPSKDKYAPAFAALLTEYTDVAVRLNTVIDALLSLDLDAEYLSDTKLNMFPFTMNDLSDILKNVQPSLKEVPSSMSIHDTVNVHNTNVTSNTLGNMMQADENNKQLKTKLYTDNSVTTSALDVIQQNDEPSALDALLGNSDTATGNVVFGNNQNQNTSMFQKSNTLFNNNQNQMLGGNKPIVTVVNDGWV